MSLSTPQPAPRPASITWPTRMLWGLALLVALISWRLLIDPMLIAPELSHHAVDRPLWFYLHIGFSPVALALLPLQFSKRIRTQRPQLHRWGGRLYAVSIAIGAAGGFTMALTSTQGPLAVSGFAVLDLAWIVTTGLAVAYARGRKFAQHRRWMIRSAALTLAAVTLRLYLPIGELTVGFETAYPLIAWLCWVPNLIFAEMLIHRQRRGAGLSG